MRRNLQPLRASELDSTHPRRAAAGGAVRLDSRLSYTIFDRCTVYFFKATHIRLHQAKWALSRKVYCDKDR